MPKTGYGHGLRVRLSIEDTVTGMNTEVVEFLAFNYDKREPKGRLSNLIQNILAPEILDRFQKHFQTNIVKRHEIGEE